MNMRGERRRPRSEQEHCGGQEPTDGRTELSSRERIYILYLALTLSLRFFFYLRQRQQYQ